MHNGGSRGFLLWVFFVAVKLLKQDQIVSELFSKFHMHVYNPIASPSPLDTITTWEGL